MPNCKSFFVTEAERKHVRRRARYRQHGDASCHQVFFFLQSKAPKEIQAILTKTLEEHAPSCTTVKNWAAQFKRGDFSTCDALRPIIHSLWFSVAYRGRGRGLGGSNPLPPKFRRPPKSCQTQPDRENC